MNILILRITLNPCPDNGIWGEIKQNKGAEMKAFEFITDKIGLADRMGYSDCLSEKEVVRVEKYSYQAPMGYGELTTGYCLKVVLEAGFQKEFWLKLSTDGQKVVDNMDRMPQGAVLVSSWDAEGNPVGQQVKTEEPSNKVEIAFDYPSACLFHINSTLYRSFLLIYAPMDFVFQIISLQNVDFCLFSHCLHFPWIPCSLHLTQ